jgi:hypothetical protein
MAKTIRLAVITMCAAFVIAVPAYGAPIRWTPEKVEATLKADSPIARGREAGNGVISAHCFGLGKGLNGKFIRFQCGNVRYRHSNGRSKQIDVRLRVQQIGVGKLCILALQLESGQVPPPPWRVAPDPVITRLFRPEKVCTT